MKDLIVKANGLIEAKYKLSLEEQRLILYLTSLIEPSDTDFKKYKIGIKMFSELANLAADNQYRKFKEISKSLISKTMTIQEGKKTIVVSWLAASVYDAGTGFVSLSFAPELKPYLLQLKEKFTRYDLFNVLYLKSVYSIRIFELLKQFENLLSRTFDVEELKQILGVDDLPAYKDFYNFKAKVILPAKKELKEKCDIYFDFVAIKEGRRVAKIKFLIYKNTKNIRKSNKNSKTNKDSDTIVVESDSKGNTASNISKGSANSDSKEKNNTYGEMNSVVLTESEYNGLLEFYGKEKLNTYINRLDLHISSKGTKYKSHYATIKKWITEDETGRNKQKREAKKTRFNNFDSRELSFKGFEKNERVGLVDTDEEKVEKEANQDDSESELPPELIGRYGVLLKSSID